MSDIICDAIKRRKILEFDYQERVRTVKPWALGLDAEGNVVLAAYQVRGYTRSRNVPFWRRYKLSGITGLVALSESFLWEGDELEHTPEMAKLLCRYQEGEIIP